MVDSRRAAENEDRDDDLEKYIRPAHAKLLARKYEKKGLRKSVGLGEASTSNANLATVEID